MRVDRGRECPEEIRKSTLKDRREEQEDGQTEVRGEERDNNNNGVTIFN